MHNKVYYLYNNITTRYGMCTYKCMEKIVRLKIAHDFLPWYVYDPAFYDYSIEEI